MAFIPEHLIDEIRNASDIVEVVSDYVTLRKKGVNYFGLCPFHSEKTPSFSVNPEKQIFHCFGCSAGGNVFSFIMREEGVDFPEAARILAKRAGIEIPEPEELGDTSVHERETLYYANELAMVFFQDQLFAEAGKEAREYMVARGFDEAGLREFGLGYAPDGWDAFLRHGREKKFKDEILEKAGLLNKREDGDYYDRFRHRLMFPILNLSGKVVAFGGRTLLEDKQTPKYVNSPETAVYHKGSILYGLYQARDTLRARGEAIFVEGYTDVMRLVLAGQQNVVATSGTALTELQARLIRRYTSKVIMLYDSDTAGAAATLRGADILVEQGMEVRIAEMAEGEDPDSFVRQFGIEALQQRLAEALPLLEYKTTHMPRESDTPARSEQIHSIINTLARIQDGIQRQEAVRAYAEKLAIAEDVLWEEVGRVRKLHMRRRQRRGGETEIFLQAPEQQDFAARSKPVEEELIRIMLLHWEAVPFIFSFMELTDFYNEDFQLIATVLYQFYDNGIRPEPEELIHYFTEPRVTEFITQVVIRESQQAGISQDFKKWAADCLAKLQRIMLDMRIEEVQKELREREQSGGDPTELLERWRDLQDQRRRVKAKNFLPESARESAT